MIALDHIDEIIKIIREAQTSEIAKEQLIDRYTLDDRQAQAILDMRLVRLTGLEREKIENEHQKLTEQLPTTKTSWRMKNASIRSFTMNC